MDKNKLIKIFFYTMTSIYLLCFILWWFFIYFYSTNLKWNIVKVEKEAEIISNENLIQDNNFEKTTCSGFFIDKKTIVTASHCVNTNNSIYTISNENIESKAELIHKDIENDIAYLSISEEYKNFKKVKNAKIKYSKNIESINYKKEVKSWTITNIIWNKIYSDIIFDDWDSWWVLLDKRWKFVWINIEKNLNEKKWVSIMINN